MIIETEKNELPVMRRTRRILERIRIVVSGKMSDGTAFNEESYTTALTGDGGVFPLKTSVSAGQILDLLRGVVAQHAFCKVAHAEPSDNGFCLVRVQLLGADTNFWDVPCPPEDWAATQQLREVERVAC